MSNDLANAALEYSYSKIAIFPLAPCGKNPLLGEWQNRASTDPATVEKWWKDQPNANIAVHVGMSGLVVLDVDPRNGGDVSLARLIEKHGSDWLSQIKIKTGGGGHHYIYSSPGNRRLPSKLGKGLDIKHGAGYIVAPPSIHPSGNRYEVVKGGLIGGELDFAPAVPNGFIPAVALMTVWPKMIGRFPACRLPRRPRRTSSAFNRHSVTFRRTAAGMNG